MKIIKWLGLLILGGIILLFISGIPQQLYKEITLRMFYAKTLEAIRNDDYETLYATTAPDVRRDISYNDWVVKNQRDEKPFYEEWIIHSYDVIGDKGIIDRSYIVCYTDCEGENKTETRLRKEYVYINGQWYAPDDNTFVCARTEPYAMPEEFSRAVSLVIQRLENSNFGAPGTTYDEESKKDAKNLKKMRNCLNIQYASSSDEMSGAEGVFLYEQGNNTDEYLIKVSPEYSIKDDLVTAILLRHELHHAMLHATGVEQIISCYENEARAFAVQVGFFHALNQEEQTSLVGRYGTSPNVKDFFDMHDSIINVKAPSLTESALPYVESSEFYQAQCADNT